MDSYIKVRGFRIQVRKLRPTRRHRLAIAPGILATVYGVNRHGHAKYFDYDWEGAYLYAGIGPNSDVRLSTPTGRYSYVHSGATEANPRRHDKCLWVVDPPEHNHEGTEPRCGCQACALEADA